MVCAQRIQGMEEGHEGAFDTAGVDGRGSHQTRQHQVVHDGSVKQRAKVGNLCHTHNTHSQVYIHTNECTPCMHLHTHTHSHTNASTHTHTHTCIQTHKCCDNKVLLHWTKQQNIPTTLPDYRKTHLCLSVDLDAEEPILHGVDDDDDITKLRGDDATPVIPRVFRPHDVNLVIPQVSHLK